MSETQSYVDRPMGILTSIVDYESGYLHSLPSAGESVSIASSIQPLGSPVTAHLQ